MFISVDEAYQKWKDSTVQFVDCRFDLQDPSKGESDYRAAHIPGAIYFNLDSDLSDPVHEHRVGGRHPLPEWGAFAQKLGDRGIDRNTEVIIYDDNHAFASRMYWMLMAMGHSSIFILNGGFPAWKYRDFPTEKGTVEKTPVEYGEFQVNEKLMADQNEVKQKLTNEDVILIDSRNAERYKGKVEPIDHKAGHIPGALNYDWSQLFEEGQLKSQPDIEKHFQGIDQNKEVIVYCGSGVTATPNVLALQQAGYTNVKLYPGSFSDWISNDENPVDKEV
ncbi:MULTISPECIES: sulfurtransferase [Allobacillus]|uniref:Sulfurtransferase n=1 Tax=Allobacillus salarius TaxID=1955272 RepID=A0A556PT04_9BACI|nr:sulfurtransferase [Allobacillus salarius]TSJ67525.1 sulfurtransferase [Allobacillus salarius]